MEKKNIRPSDHEERYINFAKQLAKTFNFSTSSSQHIRTVDGNVESNHIKHNNPGTDFRNQFEQFEANVDMSEKNIKNILFYSPLLPEPLCMELSDVDHHIESLFC